MKLILMRHGATPGNMFRRYIGRGTNEPLSPDGRLQCVQSGVFPEVKLVYTSSMRRAQQTARICFPNARLRVMADLEEFDFGRFEGKSAYDMRDDEDYRSWVDSGCTAGCPGGESRDGFVRRSNAALTELLREAAHRGEQEVIVVAHGGTIMAALFEFGPSRAGVDPYFGWHVGTCAGYVMDVHFEGECLTLDNPVHFARLPL